MVEVAVPVVGSMVARLTQLKGAVFVVVVPVVGSFAAGEYVDVEVLPNASVLTRGRPSES
ncbi:hypothetical protein NS183_05705 [Microbacterium testaceum]|nr:hypothetical protein NS183_05705 [Microbacterium testaceum]